MSRTLAGRMICFTMTESVPRTCVSSHGDPATSSRRGVSPWGARETGRIAMTATIVTVSLTLALNSFGLGHEPDHHHPHHIKERPHRAPRARRRLGLSQRQSRSLRMDRLRSRPAAGGRPHGRVLLPAILRRSSGTNVHTDVLQPVRDAEVSGIFLTWEQGVTIRPGARRRDRLPCRLLPTPTNRTLPWFGSLV